MLGSKSYCGERGLSVRVVLYENHPAAPEGEGLVNWDWPRRVGPGIHDHGVADLGDHDRIASSPGGQEALEDASDLVAIGAQGRAVIMIVVEAILGRQLMVIARVRDPTPGHMLIEQSDETLDVAGVECCCQGCSVGRHEILDCTYLAAEHVSTQDAPITQLLAPTDVPVSAARENQVDQPRRLRLDRGSRPEPRAGAVA